MEIGVYIENKWINIKDRKPIRGYPVLISVRSFLFFGNYKNGKWNDLVSWAGSTNLPQFITESDEFYWVYIKNIVYK